MQAKARRGPTKPDGLDTTPARKTISTALNDIGRHRDDLSYGLCH